MKTLTLTTGNYNVIYSSLIISRGLFTQVIETLSADSVSVMQPRYAAGNFRSWAKPPMTRYIWRW